MGSAVLLTFVVYPLLVLTQPVATAQSQATCFTETGFCISEPAFQAYFQRRGGSRVLGFPVSRAFTLEGFRVQFFQRVVLQLQAGGVQRLNVLDPGVMPMTRANSSTFPPPDPSLAASAPPPDDPNYGQKTIQFVRSVAPDRFNSAPVGFFTLFNTTVSPQVAFPDITPTPDLVTLANLEIWGLPTSQPAPDPQNPNFIYQRFQRGIMHFRADCACSEGILIGDYFKSVITGKDVPPDLAADMQSSRFRGQYDATKPGWLARPNELQGTDLTAAFEPGTAVPTPVPTTTPSPTTTPVQRIMISQSDLARLQPVLKANGLDTSDVAVARTATYVLPSAGATVTLAAPLVKPSTPAAEQLIGPTANVPIGVLQASRALPVANSRIASLQQDIYLVKVKGGHVVYVASSGQELDTGLAPDIRQLLPARKAPQASITYKDVCFAWNQVQVCSSPSPTQALTAQESANLNGRMSQAVSALASKGLLQGDVNIGATVGEAVGTTAVQQRQGNLLAAPMFSAPQLASTGAPVDGAQIGMFQVMQTLDVPGYPPVPPGAYAVLSNQGGKAARLLASDAKTTFDVPAQFGQVRGTSISPNATTEEPLAVVVDLWMVLCFFDEQDVCGG